MEQGKGNKITVNGVEFYYERGGKPSNIPVIVFESGYGWPLENWDSIRREVGEFAELFLYDRAGVGKSGKGDMPMHSLQNARNLNALLQKTGVQPPYLLVGHSFGGLNVRAYAQLYPEDVAGVILLDACHEDQNSNMVPLFTQSVQQDYLGQFTVEASLAEFEESLEQVRGKMLGNTPLLVLTGGTQPHHTKESMAAWLGFQKELAGLSSRSEQVIVAEAGHAIHLDTPSIVISEFQKMMKRMREKMEQQPFNSL